MKCMNRWLGVVFGMGLLIVLPVQAAVHLDVDFEGYTLGDIQGQTGGVVGGTWNVTTDGVSQVIGSPALGSKAASFSRASGAGSFKRVALASGLNTGAASIYYSVDFYRGDDNDRGVVTMMNSGSSNNTGLGFSVENGANPVLRYIIGGGFAGTDSTYVIENNKWHRVEFEADGVSKTYDLYVQKEGVAGRTLVADDVSWAAPNGVVTDFLYLAQGLSESNLVLDNLYLETDVAFPVDRILPEPGSLILLAGAGLAMLSGRRSRRVA